VTATQACRAETRRRPVLFICALIAASALTAAATAAFSSSTTSSGAIATTGEAPTGLTAACVTLSSNVTLSWTATTSTAAAGYRILRSSTTGGPYTQIGTVTSRTTTTYTDTISILQTQYYVAEATRNNWTSPNSNQAGVRSIGLGVCSQA
jgi:hypothetical protein